MFFFKHSSSISKNIMLPKKIQCPRDASDTQVCAKAKKIILSFIDMLEGSLSLRPPFVISTLNILNLYFTVCLRWLAVYLKAKFKTVGPGRWIRLQDLCLLFYTRPSVAQAALAEGLGQTVLSNPSRTVPPEGLAT
jgi:glutathione S-transferase